MKIEIFFILVILVFTKPVFAQLTEEKLVKIKEFEQVLQSNKKEGLYQAIIRIGEDTDLLEYMKKNQPNLYRAYQSGLLEVKVERMKTIRQRTLSIPLEGRGILGSEVRKSRDNASVFLYLLDQVFPP